MTTLERRWEAYRRRNDCVELYPRRLTGMRARAFNAVRRLGPPLQYRYLRWLGAEILWNERTVEYFTVSRMLPPPPCRVLDLGSASSRWPIQLASAGYEVTALDVRDLGYEHPGVEFVRASVFDFAPAGSFRCVTAISVVEHFGLGHYGDEDRAGGDVEALRRVAGWLEPAGVLLLSVPYGEAGRTPKHRIYDASGLARLCAAFNVVEERYFRREGEAWAPASAASLAGIPSPGLPVNGVAIRMLRPRVPE